MKIYLKELFPLLFLMLFASTAMSATLIEQYIYYSVIKNSAASNPQYMVTEHNQCNKTEYNKSKINNKSLNPFCNLCLGDDDSSTNIYVSGPRSVLGGGGGGSSLTTETGDTATLAVCLNGTSASNPDNTIPFTNEVIADATMLCTTRGGTFSSSIFYLQCLFP